MELTSLALRVLVLLLPGVVCALFFEKLTIHRPWSNFRFVIYIFLSGASVYLVLSLVSVLFSFICSLLGYESLWTVAFWDALLDDKVKVSFLEVGLSMFVAVPVAYAVSACASRNLANRFGVWLGATRKYGDDPLYYAELASLGKPLLRIWTEQGLVYEGKVRALSKEGGFNELTIEDVIVCDRRLVFLYRLKMAFFSLGDTNITIEVVPPRDLGIVKKAGDENDQGH